MKFIYSIFFCVLVTSCSATFNSKSVKYKFKVDDSTIIVAGKVPGRWTNSRKLEVVNKNFDIEYQYIYADSSIFYISNAETFCFPNYNNIKNINTEESKLRLQDHRFVAESNEFSIMKGYLSTIMPSAPYNMVFSGKDEQGLYWKDIKYGEVSIGYTSVSEENKYFFDAALDLFIVSLRY